MLVPLCVSLSQENFPSCSPDTACLACMFVCEREKACKRVWWVNGSLSWPCKALGTWLDCRVRVAQLVEHQSGNLNVMGLFPAPARPFQPLLYFLLISCPQHGLWTAFEMIYYLGVGNRRKASSLSQTSYKILSSYPENSPRYGQLKDIGSVGHLVEPPSLSVILENPNYQPATLNYGLSVAMLSI